MRLSCGKTRIESIVQTYDDLFQGVGLLEDGDVRLNVDPSVPPVCSPYRPIPFAYRHALSEHLADLRRQDKIEDVDPTEECGWVSNVVITEKKASAPATTGSVNKRAPIIKESIRMNIDMREPNRAIIRTKTHLETIQELRHRLQVPYALVKWI